MKTTASASKICLGTGLVALLALSACQPPPSTVRDTGNMAYPAPLPQGLVGSGTATARTPDTGNMAYPAPLPQGNLATTSTPSNTRRPDTGAVSYPAATPQGNVETTRVSK